MIGLLAIIGTALDLLPGVTRAISQIANHAQQASDRRGKPVFGRLHHWCVGLTDPPVCAYCEKVMTNENRYTLCPGPV